MSPHEDLLKQAERGSTRALGKLARMLDDESPGYEEILAALFPSSGNAHIVGITGPPGAGKSTLVSSLTGILREIGRKVAVLAVDPTSPFTGGAVLGDRIRMQEHATDEGVFIRSLATRGHMGGLTRSVRSQVILLDAMGFDTILLETVGVGQEEVEVKDMVHTTVYITVPGLGDSIQAMKAGVLEIAHIYLVNKADLPMVDATVKDLEAMLAMVNGHESWRPPVMKSVAVDGNGVPELLEKVDEHRAHLESSGELEDWNERSAEINLVRSLQELIRSKAAAALDEHEEELAGDIGRIANREEDPLSVARKWLGKLDLTGK
jgi:LAO/AO transport system kinase